ncbi:MAG: hypothetical protein IGQ45_05630 [Cyanobacterium sp. T60_A2020_053]|nr:hypothetical protein [Cyanobacterium sp. T60_A2020_053]
MNEIILKEIKPSLLSKLTNLATLHSRTLEEEITAILEDATANKTWSANFFELTSGCWQGESLVRETQPAYQEREDLL